MGRSQQTDLEKEAWFGFIFAVNQAAPLAFAGRLTITVNYSLKLPIFIHSDHFKSECVGFCLSLSLCALFF